MVLFRSNEFERKTKEYHGVADQCECDIRQEIQQIVLKNQICFKFKTLIGKTSNISEIFNAKDGPLKRQNCSFFHSQFKKQSNRIRTVCTF